MRKPFIIFDLNGVLCHSKHISHSASKGPFRSPQNMDYGGRFDTLINNKVVRARPGLRCFLRDVLGLAYIRRLAYHPGIVPDFVLSNPIGNRPLGPQDEDFRELYNYAKLNKLV